MKKKRKLKKSVKLIIFIILIFIMIPLVQNVTLKLKLKNMGYTNNQIEQFYELEFNLNLILKYGYCSNIEQILNIDYNKDDLENYLKGCVNSNENKGESELPEQKDPLVIDLEKQKYYIPYNLERYIAYNDGVKTAEEIVSEVNCNLDKEYFVDSKEADLSMNNLVLVNKYYRVNSGYKPESTKVLQLNKYTYWEDSVLQSDAYDAFLKLVDDAKKLGYNLIDTSAFRTYEYQNKLYNNSVNNNGLEVALKLTAKPGYSEHHTGLATDIVKIGVSMYDFESTNEYVWLKDVAHKYGFILRYPKGKEHLTGYQFEPWHYRYVGVDVATYIYENDIVFEEYYSYFCEYKKNC